MRAILTVVLALMLAVPAGRPAWSETCSEPAEALGVARVVEIDTTAGPLFGDISVYAREPRFLAPNEVVLTFDDGPMPWITQSILDTLDRFCTKATFFSVGRMAIAYPNSIKDILARGHTLGSHTWSHPLNLKRLSVHAATDQIERGFAAIALAAGQPIAPFFRFPGLSDSGPLLAHLQQRGIGAFTVDVVSNDSYIRDASRLAQYTLRQVEKMQGGIVLFHDIKAATAKALPEILTALKERGYTVVHMRSKKPFEPLLEYTPVLAAVLAKAEVAAADKPALLPFFGSPAVLKSLNGGELAVTALAPEPKVRVQTRASPETQPVRTRKRHSLATGPSVLSAAPPPPRQQRTLPAKASGNGGFFLFNF